MDERTWDIVGKCLAGKAERVKGGNKQKSLRQYLENSKPIDFHIVYGGFGDGEPNGLQLLLQGPDGKYITLTADWYDEWKDAPIKGVSLDASRMKTEEETEEETEGAGE